MLQVFAGWLGMRRRLIGGLAGLPVMAGAGRHSVVVRRPMSPRGLRQFGSVLRCQRLYRQACAGSDGPGHDPAPPGGRVPRECNAQPSRDLRCTRREPQNNDDDDSYDDEDDDLRPALGIVVGLSLGALCWLTVFFVLWWMELF
jgi:hypothetical protein